MELSLARKCLEDLVRENDKVEVPLLGTFLTVVIPSRFSSDRKTITPPFKKLTLTKGEITIPRSWIFIERLANMADISPDRARTEWKKLMEKHSSDIEALINTDTHPEIFPENVMLQTVAIPKDGGPRRLAGNAAIWIPGLLVALSLIAAMVCYYLGWFQI